MATPLPGTIQQAFDAAYQAKVEAETAARTLADLEEKNKTILQSIDLATQDHDSKAEWLAQRRQALMDMIDLFLSEGGTAGDEAAAASAKKKVA